jgi:hypothetical protein
MKKAGKKRVGRPSGRVAPHRPVVGARVAQALYDEIKAAAAAAGRTMGEELVWRAEKAGEWSKAFGELEEWKTKLRDEQAQIARGNLEIVLMGLNWKKVRGVRFGDANWISPDNHSYPQSGFVDPAPETGEAAKKRKQP